MKIACRAAQPEMWGITATFRAVDRVLKTAVILGYLFPVLTSIMFIFLIRDANVNENWTSSTAMKSVGCITSIFFFVQIWVW